MRFPNLVQSLNSRMSPTYFLENENENYTFWKLHILINYLFKYLFDSRTNTLSTL